MRTLNKNPKERGWHQSEADPDVQYLIEPLMNSEKAELINYTPIVRPEGKGGESRSDARWVSMMLFRASLKDITGVIDPDTGQELKLLFTESRISKKLTLELCQKELYDQMDSDLIAEVLDIINAKNNLSKEEEKDVNFTSSLSQETDTRSAEPVTGTMNGAEFVPDSSGSE